MQNSFKILLLSFIMLSTLASCGSDEDECDATNIENAIVGKWVYPLTSETVEFKADGKLVDPQNSTINGTETAEKSWQVNRDGNVEVKSTTGSSSNETIILISSFTCDEINTVHYGFPRTMERD